MTAIITALSTVPATKSCRGSVIATRAIAANSTTEVAAPKYARSDDRIREDVNDRLTEDVWVDASEIEVSVTDGEVTLAGTVDDRRDQAARRGLRRCGLGRQACPNNLRYTSGVVSPKISELSAGAAGPRPAAALAPGYDGTHQSRRKSIAHTARGAWSLTIDVRRFVIYSMAASWARGSRYPFA